MTARTKGAVQPEQSERASGEEVMWPGSDAASNQVGPCRLQKQPGLPLAR